MSLHTNDTEILAAIDAHLETNADLAITEALRENILRECRSLMEEGVGLEHAKDLATVVPVAVRNMVALQNTADISAPLKDQPDRNLKFQRGYQGPSVDPDDIVQRLAHRMGGDRTKNDHSHLQ